VNVPTKKLTPHNAYHIASAVAESQREKRRTTRFLEDDSIY
jgi:hypothetical protein